MHSILSQLTCNESAIENVRQCNILCNDHPPQTIVYAMMQYKQLTSLVRTAAAIPAPITIKKLMIHKPKDT